MGPFSPSSDTTDSLLCADSRLVREGARDGPKPLSHSDTGGASELQGAMRSNEQGCVCVCVSVSA